MSALCQPGNTRRAAVAMAQSEFGRIARLATRDGVAGERGQRLVPERRAELDRQRAALADHVSQCPTCAEVTVSA